MDKRISTIGLVVMVALLIVGMWLVKREPINIGGDPPDCQPTTPEGMSFTEPDLPFVDYLTEKNQINQQVEPEIRCTYRRIFGNEEIRWIHDGESDLKAYWAYKYDNRQGDISILRSDTYEQLKYLSCNYSHSEADCDGQL